MWWWFQKQDKALEALKTINNQNCAIFAKEIHPSGARKFLVTRYDEFEQRYKYQMQSYQRCYYELIESDKPLKLYFDIEYSQIANETSQCEFLMTTFKTLLIDFVKQKHNIVLSAQNIIDLTSTVPSKFSRHLIVGDVVFENYIHCKIFVEHFCNELKSLVCKNDAVKSLFVNSSKLEQTHPLLFVDQSVYTKNRCFRILQSSKLKKIQQGTPARLSFRFSDQRQTIPFLNTLVTYMNSNTKNYIRYSYNTLYKMSKKSYHISSTNRNNFNKVKLKSCNDKFQSIHEYMLEFAPEWPSQLNSSHCNQSNTGTIYKYVVETQSDGTVLAVTYFVKGNRWCANINRQHQRNNITFRVCLAQSYVLYSYF